MSLLGFYIGLPTLDQVGDSFYIRGYTETLREFYDGVRVCPSEGFCSIPQEFKNYPYSTGYPFYVIPKFENSECWGLVFKGYKKATPTYNSSSRSLPLLYNRVLKGDCVYLVEGIKDSYVLLKLGLKAVPMLTTLPTKKIMKELKSKEVKIIYVPDNDSGDVFKGRVKAFNALAESFGITSYATFKIKSVQDLGDYFLESEELRNNSVREGLNLKEATGGI